MEHIHQLDTAIKAADTILLLQPDGADGDSLGTTLALEEILSEMGKTVEMYIYRDIPTYLQTLEGWDRVGHELPKRFDLSIIVDTGSPMQLQATLSTYQAELSRRPMIIIDHHGVRSPMPFETLDVIDAKAAAAAEMIVAIAKKLEWKINQSAAEKLASAILSDSLNLTTPTTTPTTIRAYADLVEIGADPSELYRRKREVSALSPDLLRLKASLLSTVEYVGEDAGLALVTIPYDIIREYDTIHSPGDLVIWDLMWVKGVNVAAVLNDYGDKVKGSMRAQRPIAGQIAELLGGGGHAGAAGFRLDKTKIKEAREKLISAYNSENKS